MGRTVIDSIREGFDEDPNRVAAYEAWLGQRISWNGGEPKYDIRDWSGDHQKMGKGVTLTESEMRILYELLGAEIEELDK